MLDKRFPRKVSTWAHIAHDRPATRPDHLVQWHSLSELQWMLVSKRYKLPRTHRTFTLLVSAAASSSTFQSWPWWSFKSVQRWRMRPTERRERKKYSPSIRFCSASLRRQRSERVAFSCSWVGGEWQWIKELCVCVWSCLALPHTHGGGSSQYPGVSGWA